MSFWLFLEIFLEKEQHNSGIVLGFNPAFFLGIPIKMFYEFNQEFHFKKNFGISLCINSEISPENLKKFAKLLPTI